MWPEVVCKPGSVPAPGCPGAGEDHSSRRRIAAPLERSDPRTGTPPGGWSRSDEPPSAVRLFEFAPRRGLPRRRSPGSRAWALTPRFHPCLCLPVGRLSPRPPDLQPSAVWFLLRFPSGCPGLPLTTSLLCGARTFLPRTARCRPPAILRPPPASESVPDRQALRGIGIAAVRPRARRERATLRGHASDPDRRARGRAV